MNYIVKIKLTLYGAHILCLNTHTQNGTSNTQMLVLSSPEEGSEAVEC